MSERNPKDKVFSAPDRPKKDLEDSIFLWNPYDAKFKK